MSAADPNFTDIMNMKVDDAKPPAAWPPGIYAFVIMAHEHGQTTPREQGKTPTPYVEFHLKAQSADPTVDKAALEAALDGKGISEKEWKGRDTTFYKTPAAIFMLKNFLNCIKGLNTSGRSFDEVLAQTSGKTVKAQVINVPANDGSGRVYTNIKGWVA